MSRRNNMKKTYLTDEEAAQLSEWADEAGKSESALLREAILEYLDRDRGDRIEDVVRQNQAMLEDIRDTLNSDGAHTHTSAPTPSKGSSTVEKARDIARRLYENHDPPVKELDVERAIEDIAGADDRTLKKYKGLLKKRGLLYRHPTSAVWTDDREEWVGWVEGVSVGEDVHDCVDDYPIDAEEYADLVAEVVEA
jgi:hypothetical protein